MRRVESTAPLSVRQAEASPSLRWLAVVWLRESVSGEGEHLSLFAHRTAVAHGSALGALALGGPLASSAELHQALHHSIISPLARGFFSSSLVPV